MRLCLTILAGQRAGEQLVIEPPGGTLGRSTDCAVCLPDASISRHHAELRWDGQSWLLRRVSSNSPTVIDSTLATATEVRLASVGQLRLGNVLFQYAEQQAPAALPASHSPLRAQVSALPASLIEQLEPLQFSQSTPGQNFGVRGAAIGNPSPPTLIRRHSSGESSTGPHAGTEMPTLVLSGVRRPVSEPRDESLATLIRRPSPQTTVADPKPVIDPKAVAPTPPTMIRRAVPQPPRLDPPVSAPPTLIRLTAPQASAAVKPISVSAVDAASLVEHIDDQSRSKAAQAPDESASLKRRFDELTQERDRLRVEVAQLKHETDSLRATQTTLQEQWAARNEAAPIQAIPSLESATPTGTIEGMRLTGELGDLLEQASQALKSGDPTRAGALIREASFALADFRDLCQAERS